MIGDHKLASLARFDDLSLLALRLMTGIFLIYGVWDNIIDAARMREFVDYVDKFGFPWPHLAAPFSVWVQFGCGLAFVTGFLTRSFALLCIANFVVALAMVHLHEDLRGWWPALALVGIGGILATHGSGRYGLDAWLAARR